MFATAIIGVVYFITSIRERAVAKQLQVKQDELMRAKDAQFASNLKDKEVEIARLQQARVVLEAKVAWRRMDQQTQSAIASRLERFSGQLASVWFNASDAEGTTFSKDIWVALKAAHWKVFAPAGKIDVAESGRLDPVAAQFGIIVTSTSDGPSRRAADALVAELNSAGFDSSQSPKVEQRSTPLVIVSVEFSLRGPRGKQNSDSLYRDNCRIGRLRKLNKR